MAKTGEGVRDGYSAHPEGADGWYRDNGASYRNPHEDAVGDVLALAVKWWPLAFAGQVLDLSCGSGEATLALRAAGVSAERIDACDPYTQEAFAARVGRSLQPWSFADIAAGALIGHTYSGIVCSYALHLCEPSRLAGVCLALAAASPALVIVTPHKRPEIGPKFGWDLIDDHRDISLRVRLRLYEANGLVAADR